MMADSSQFRLPAIASNVSGMAQEAAKRRIVTSPTQHCSSQERGTIQPDDSRPPSGRSTLRHR